MGFGARLGLELVLLILTEFLLVLTQSHHSRPGGAAFTMMVWTQPHIGLLDLWIWPGTG
jgi:hypothetical protein